jgi:PAS domain-containing protein
MVIENELLEKLQKAGIFFASGLNFKALISLVVEEALEMSGSDLGCVYLFERPEEKQTHCKLIYKKGKYDVPLTILEDDESLIFIRECQEAIVVLEKKQETLATVLLHPKMESGMVFPLATSSLQWGLLFLNSREKNYYTKRHFTFLHFYTLLAGEKLYTSRLIEKLKTELTQVEEAFSFQEMILGALVPMLIVLDSEGCINYFNDSAKRRFGFPESSKGKDGMSLLAACLDESLLTQIKTALERPELVILTRGKYKDTFISEPDSVCNLYLKISPLSKEHDYKGILLLFTEINGKGDK